MSEKRTRPAAEAVPPDAERRGRLIAIEGIDGTGKTTLAAALADALRQRGVEVVLTAEPTHGPYGRKVRALARSGRDAVSPELEAQWFTLDRRDHVEQVIRPALQAGRFVITDRYFYSTMAYQGARGVDPLAIERENRRFAPDPDLLILLDLPVAEALERIRVKRGDTPDLFESEAYLRRVRDQFEKMRRRHETRSRRLERTAEELERVRALFTSFQPRVAHLLRLDAREPTAALAARALAHIERQGWLG